MSVETGAATYGGTIVNNPLSTFIGSSKSWERSPAIKIATTWWVHQIFWRILTQGNCERNIDIWKYFWCQVKLWPFFSFRSYRSHTCSILYFYELEAAWRISFDLSNLSNLHEIYQIYCIDIIFTFNFYPQCPNICNFSYRSFLT